MPTAMSDHTEFWKNTPLDELSPDQWESLCDGCGKCCLQKLEDRDTGEIFYTNIACRLLDTDTGHCSDYCNRKVRNPDCISLTLAELDDPYWLPSTCAYRLLANGQDLPPWHPLLTGDPDSVLEAGMGTAGRVTHLPNGGDLEHHLIDWVD